MCYKKQVVVDKYIFTTIAKIITKANWNYCEGRREGHMK